MDHSNRVSVFQRSNTLNGSQRRGVVETGGDEMLLWTNSRPPPFCCFLLKTSSTTIDGLQRWRTTGYGSRQHLLRPTTEIKKKEQDDKP